MTLSSLPERGRATAMHDLPAVLVHRNRRVVPCVRAPSLGVAALADVLVAVTTEEVWYHVFAQATLKPLFLL